MPAKVTKEQLTELEFLKEEERRLTAEAGLEDFWFFVTNCLWPEESKVHLYEPLHRPIADKVSQFKPGTRDLLIMMRKGRKTNLRTIALCCWLMAKDIDIRIMVISSLDRTAKDFLAAVKRQLQQNKTLLHYYPHLKVEGKLGNELAFTHPSRTKYNLVDPTMFATYLGAPLVGRRFDVCIMDDAVDDEDVSTPEQAGKALRFLNAVFPLADENPKWNWIVVNGTRKGYNDIYAALMGQGMGSDVDVELKAPPFTSTVIPALVDNEGEADIDGTPTFPTVLSKEVLMTYLAQSRANPVEGEGYFYREYLCQCQAPSEQKFLDEWFNSWTPVLPPVVWSGILVDSATKDKQVLHRGDFTVALVAHYDVHGHLYLTDGVRSDAFRFSDLTRELLVLSERAGGCYNIVKEKVGEEIFFPAVEDVFHRSRKPCTTYALSVRTEGKKIVRIIDALQGPFQARKIHFVGDGQRVGFPYALWKVLKDELTHLGQWSHDDTADALSLAFHKDIRIVPSARRGAEWTPFTRARLPGLSDQRNNPAALNMRVARGGGDGTLRQVDPFVKMIREQEERLPSNARPQGWRPMSVKVESE